MGYIENNLMEGEISIAKASMHWIVFLGPIIVTLVLLYFAKSALFMLIIALIFIVWAYLYFSSAEFEVTNRRVIARWGLIIRHSKEMNMDKVEGVSINEGIIGSKLGYGTVILNGTNGSHETFPSIANPLAFRKQILEHTTKNFKA